MNNEFLVSLIVSLFFPIGLGLVRFFRVRKRNRKTIEKINADAIRGDAVAQNNLGYIYQSGTGVKYGFRVNNKIAVYWFKMSAEQGNAYAQFNLFYCYRNGVSVERNDVIALEWLEKSANQGFPKAQSMLKELKAKERRA